MSCARRCGELPDMTFSAQQALQRTIEHREIFHDEMVDLMRQIMRGEVSAPMMAAILSGLRVKKETVGEIAAAASVMREMAVRVHAPPYKHFVDIVGTGGDGANSFNISTAAMFVVAAAGARVAKHGNRSVSSKSGSADVLEALGARIDLSAEQVSMCLHDTGIGFMFAPNHHPAMRVVAPVRREMGVRTLFNILGPLTNPAGAPNILLGVFHPDLVGIQVRVLERLGAGHALVVWGRDGIDEISLSDATLVGELRDGRVHEYELTPEQFGFKRVSREAFAVNDAAESKARVLAALDDAPGAVRDIVLLNAGAALYAADVVDSIANGVARAREVVASGAARARLDAFLAATRRFGETP
jgi:anthranilate phosphoribosyltransferase